MRKQFILALIAVAPLIAAPVWADRSRGSYETMTGPGAAGPYGVGAGSTEYGAGSMMQRRERIGRSTMIGSSSAQTESATVEGESVYSFKPPSFSAQLPLSQPNPALSRVTMFSESLLRNPALTPSAVNLQGLTNPGSSNLGELPSPFSVELPLSRHRHPRGSVLEQQMLNPLEGL